ncbi:hypothetical protein K1T71_001365 [Dendrolimus kikuchii]|uniref:Uncharacterized protein n=1 Tax=Dendrolimus kikuchii TaxID=765133 RepID=A0ACC1DHE5_9NEOP|nr:hypothetical protein K1T71_001365 [Dendrolimus kikuchii]
MYFLLTILCSIVLIGKVSSASVDIGDSPCNENDSDCLLKITKILYAQVIKGDKDLEIPTSDPMYIKNIDGKFSDIDYELKNTTVVGFADCEVRKAVLAEDKNKATFNIFCPKLSLSGQYAVNGKILELPIQGEGDYKVILRGYDITIDADIKKVTRDDNTYISFTKLNLNANLTNGIDFDVENLFGGNAQFAEPAQKFLTENWKPIADALQMPAIESYFKEIFQNTNKYLKTIPANKIIK